MIDLRRTRESRREISIVPLINVVFLLLIYFLVVGTLDKIELIPIDPPDAESGKIVNEGNIVILLGKHEEVIIDDDLVSMEEIMPIVTKKLEKFPDKIITIKADASVPATKLIQAMDMVRAGGGNNISLVTQRVN